MGDCSGDFLVPTNWAALAKAYQNNHRLSSALMAGDGSLTFGVQNEKRPPKKGRPLLCRGNRLSCLLFEEAPRNTERTEGGPEQHNCGAAIWDLSGDRRHWTAGCAGVLVKPKHCGTKDHSNQREFLYGNDIVFHNFLCFPH
jgi:hypothetical protein